LLESWTKNNLVYVDAPVDLELGLRRAEAMITFAAGLPGSLYLYQGEEFGLPEVLDIPAERREDPLFIRTEGRELGRDGCRVPLPWGADRASSFGFSGDGSPAAPWLPQPDDWGRYAADAQAADPTSTLSLYHSLMAARRSLDPSIGLDWELTDHDSLVVFRRGSLLVALNVANTTESLPAGLVAGATVAFSSVRGHSDPTTVPADACLWLRLAH
jgi:alpha-glucosidase